MTAQAVSRDDEREREREREFSLTYGFSLEMEGEIPAAEGVRYHPSITSDIAAFEGGNDLSKIYQKSCKGKV